MSGQFFGDRFHSVLIAAAVADEHDGLEAGDLEAAANVAQQRAVGVFRQADRARVLHVQRGGIEISLGNERDDGGDEGVAQLPGDRLGGPPQDDIVLAGGEVGAVLFDPAGGDDDGLLAGRHGVADFHPGEVFEKDRFDRVDGAFALGIGIHRIGHGLKGPCRSGQHEQAQGHPARPCGKAGRQAGGAGVD